MEKIWVIRDGQIGTAHIGRDGNLKDFRAGVIDWDSADRVNLVVKPANGVVAEVGRFTIGRRIVGTDADWNWRFADFLPVVAITLFVGEEELTLELPTFAWYRSKETTAQVEENYQKFKIQQQQAEEDRQLHIQLRETQRQQKVQEFKAAFSCATFSLPEQRWLNRFVQLNKAQDQVENLIRVRFPDSARDFLQAEGLDGLKALIASCKPVNH